MQYVHYCGKPFVHACSLGRWGSNMAVSFITPFCQTIRHASDYHCYCEQNFVWVHYYRYAAFKIDTVSDIQKTHVYDIQKLGENCDTSLIDKHAFGYCGCHCD